MPVNIEIIRDNQVVLQTYLEPLTSADMNHLKETMDREILPAVPHKVHIIANFRHITNLPTSMLTSGINMMNRAHPNTGTIICVTPNEFVRAIARIFSGVLSRHHVRIVKTLDEAHNEVELLLLEKVG